MTPKCCRCGRWYRSSGIVRGRMVPDCECDGLRDTLAASLAVEQGFTVPVKVGDAEFAAHKRGPFLVAHVEGIGRMVFRAASSSESDAMVKTLDARLPL